MLERVFPIRPRWFVVVASALLGTIVVTPAAGQEVVQQLPNPASGQLTEAMQRLSRNPDSLPALLDAGRASLQLGDIDAAQGFFMRAQAIAPEDGRVLAGLAVISLRQQQPVEALELFAQAGRAGTDLTGYAAERGLAYDLVGNNAEAQRLYDVALSREETPETVRRLALSYAIGGDLEASEATLLPLLQRSDLAAFRARAFALAIHGKEDEAISIAETMLPPRLSRRMASYLRNMQQLTRAQQAAAANLGAFPPASQVGRDDPRFAGLAGPEPSPRTPPRSADSRLIPGGEPLVQVPPVRSEPREAPSGPITESIRSEPPGLADLDDEEPVIERPADPAPQPSFSISERAAPESADGEPAPDLRQAFADFALQNAAPEEAPRRNAVDITRIDPIRESPEPPPPAHPSRHWVQVATGGDVDAFRFDWRRIVRNAGGLLDGREAYRARWNQSNRLLTGPFESTGAAQEFVTALAREGVDAFRFTSARGEEVVSLD